MSGEQQESRGLSRAVLRGIFWGLPLGITAMVALFALWALRRPAPGPPVLAEVPPFTLTERSGRTVEAADLAGSPWVADFIFTRCAGPCPMMTQRLARLGDRLPPGVARVSFSVDPDYDTPEVLTAYAERFGAGGDWLFLTGERQAIWDLSVQGFKLTAGEASGTPNEHGPVLHSTRFVLVDGHGRIRGYYDAFEADELDRLVREAEAVFGG